MTASAAARSTSSKGFASTRGSPSRCSKPRLAANADAIVAQSKGIAGTDEAEFLENLDLLETLVRDAVRAAVREGDPALIHADIGPQLARLGGQLGAECGSRLLYSIEALRSEMMFTPNRPLMVEALLAAAAGGPFPRARRR